MPHPASDGGRLSLAGSVRWNNAKIRPIYGELCEKALRTGLNPKIMLQPSEYQTRQMATGCPRNREFEYAVFGAAIPSN
jgi:hypothetical protein